MYLSGTVIQGKGRGKKIGFPTANLSLFEHVMIEGVYIATTYFENKKYSSLFFSGKAETFYDTHKSYEVYLLDFNKNIYGKIVTVDILKKIRDNKKFENVEKLKEAIQQDIMIAKQYFQGH